MADFAVLGAGAMGTAMSYLLGSNGYEVLMWARRKEIAEGINRRNMNVEYMPNVALPERVKATTNLEKCFESSREIILAVPSRGVYDLCLKFRKYQPSDKHWLSVIKGMDVNFRRTISQLLKDKLYVEEDKIAVLSGPNFAIEIVENVPTVGVIGCKSKTTAAIFRDSLTTKHFLVGVTNDVQGVEIGGILKNIGAIAIGLIDGSNLGDNTRGLVFSRFFQETLEIGEKIFKARQETLLGPACLGDMIATTFSLKSRNRIIGLLASKCITNIPKDTFITEGKGNTEIIRELARKHKLSVPITDFVHGALSGVKPYIVFNNLWEQLKKETAHVRSIN